MFSKIMTPVDLAHKDDLEKALAVSADLAKHYGATVVYVGATTSTPSSTAHTPNEYKQKLEAFAKEQADKHGIETAGDMVISHDPSAEIDDVLLKAVKEEGVDCIVMQSHMPSFLDYIWPSNGGKIAEHAKCSVFVVRG